MNAVETRMSKRLMVAVLAASFCLLLAATPALADSVVFTSDAYIGPDNDTYDNQDIVVDGCTVTIDGQHPFVSLELINGAAVTHSVNGATPQYMLDLTIDQHVTVEAGSRIHADGRGYPRAQGPGAGGSAYYSAGGGHGGEGGDSQDTGGGGAYGAILQPADHGSGGGNGSYGGAGGGVVRLVVGSSLQVDGQITVDGANASSHGGGGAGGSIYCTVETLAGAGIIAANGGSASNGSCGGGAGGRVAIEYTTNSYTGSMSAAGSYGRQYGGAGTVYLKAEAAPIGSVRVDNGGANGAWTPIGTPEAIDLHVANYGIVYPSEALTVTDLHVEEDGYLTHSFGSAAGLNLTVLGDGQVDLGGQITAVGRGHAAASGPGAGGSAYYSAGAGYGGNGAGSTDTGGGGGYGSVLAPTDLGSGGGNGSSGGRGGGSIRLIVSGTLQNNGQIRANGYDATGHGGGGSGGSIYMTVASLAGEGTITANGGQAVNGSCGGGGGGRIAVEYDVNDFTGTVSAYGRGVSRFGGAGSVYLKPNAATVGNLFLDNGANSGAWTPITSPEAFNVTIANMAIVYPTAELTIGDLHVAADGVLLHSTGSEAGLVVNIGGDAIVDSAGAISASGRGYAPSGGPGEGGDAYYSAGAGHGGNGGGSNGASGGNAYGDVLAPTALGSGGGNSTDGGRGGGAIRLIVTGTCQIDGQLVAHGNTATGHGGGGSGGSIYVTAGTLAGGGTIGANGGTVVNGNCGGGGGGRIAIEYGLNEFGGAITANGSYGYQYGGAGSIYTKANTDAVGHLLLDNAGAWGAWTPLTSPEAFNLTIGNMAIAYPTEPLTVDNLVVADNGLLTHSTGSEAGLTVTVESDATVEAAGSLSTSGRGYGPSSGPGEGGDAYYSAGAAHGGNGGGSNDAGGGSAYGDVLAPTALGSGGGHTSSGGRGGGAIRLIVAGTCQIDGQLVAHGNTATGHGGGGAGGSIYLTVGTLAGGGTIAANGGTIENGNCGGGGGGRIAIEFDTDDFSGTRTTFGGGGYTYGGAGTVYLKPAGEDVGTLHCDNGGNWGAWTPITSPVPFNVTMANRATVYPHRNPQHRRSARRRGRLAHPHQRVHRLRPDRQRRRNRKRWCVDFGRRPWTRSQ